MNINFIRSLSDEILRENQQLKTEIITLKRNVSDYEEEMINAITEVAPSPLASPRGVLRGFIEKVRQVMKAREETETALKDKASECKSAQLQSQMAQQQLLCLQSQLQLARQKQSQLQEQLTVSASREQRECESLRAANEQLSVELIQLKEQLRLERMMMVEAKRREVEEVRQYHMKELLDFREKADREVVVVEKQMQTQLAEKDSTIKHLEKALEKLSLNMKLDESESDIMVKLLRSFQQYNHLSQVIQERSQEISRFRQQLQEVDMSRIKAESKLKEITSSQINLLGQIQRLSAEKRDLQRRLAAKALSLQKSEQDKDAMERYYDSKWNKEYGNVKVQLEKTYNEKIYKIEAECAGKLQRLELAVEEAEIRVAQVNQRNDMLEEEMRDSFNELQRMKRRAERLQNLNAELKQEKRQLAVMAKQELHQVKSNQSQSASFYQHQIANLNTLITLEKNIYQDLQKQHKLDLQQLSESHQAQLQKTLAEKQWDRKVLQNTHQKELLALQIKLESKQRFIEDARSNLTQQIEHEYQKRVQAAQRQVQARSREKEQQLTRHNSKWMVRFKEVDLKYTNLKKRTEDEQELYRKQITRLEAENKTLRSSEEKLHAEVKESMVLKNQFLIRIGDLDKRIGQLNLQLEQTAENTAELEDQIEKKILQVSGLKEARQSWLTEITDLQKAFKGEFQSLKRTHDKQVGVLKSKIWELEELARKRPIKRKDFERLQEMDRERRQLRNQVYIKQAQNIILNQVKDYYQTKLREEEKPPVEESRAGTALMGFKLKMLKRSTNKQGLTFNELEEPKEATEMRKYIVKSTKRSMKLSLSKIRCEDVSRYHRMHTAYD